MSRLNKRQLRAQQELAELGAQLDESSPGLGGQAGKTDEHDEDDEVEAPAPAKKTQGATSMFAALGGEDAEEEEEEDAPSDAEAAEASMRAKKKKKPKKKKKAAAVAADEAEHGGESTPLDTGVDSPRSASTRAAAKKKKGGAGTTGRPSALANNKGVDDMSLEELDALLASQAQVSDASAAAGGSSSSAPIGTASATALQARSTLSVAATSLDPQIELRKQFGSAAIRAFEAEVRANASGNSNTARARMQARNPNLKIRSFLVQPKGEWPPVTLTKSGMHMEEVNVPGRGKCYTWVHSRSYLETQIRFLEAVHSHDANQLYGVFYAHPWHIDTLLQLSDVSRHQGDLGQASDWNARALWAFERAALPPFVASLMSSNGPPQLDFSRKETRAFFLAAHRQVGFLGRRGTWRTALEWTKLILGLDLLDPHAMLLCMDFLAIKSGEEEWFLDTFEKLDAARIKVDLDVGRRCTPGSSALDEATRKAGQQRGALDWCVGLAYGRALALRSLEERSKASDHSKSDAALREAIARHPEVVQPLAEKIGATVPSPILQHPYFITWKRHSDNYDPLPHLLAAIYTHRSESLWKDPAMSSWLVRTVESVYQKLKDTDGFKKRAAASADNETRDSVYRHIYASDLPDNLRQTFLGFLPPDITAESSDACDPLPPIGADGQRGNHDYFAPLYRSGQRGMGGPASEGLPEGAGAHGERVYEAMMAAHADHPEELRNIMREMEELQPQLRNIDANAARGGTQGVIHRFGNLLNQLLELAGTGRDAGDAVPDEEEDGEEWEGSEDDDEDEDDNGNAARIPGGWAG
ncbi:unnamed protein product [Tilletia laevis]|uniref:DUF654-domain-containing protein n=2 Tax=Tilletia TaxID=13289 RepID=A0A9N8L7G1_9BASI|nr:unnamed protein product [Tilletia caries]CAD6898003.1 unnamed protein product [Tilletia laevis]CAD6911477.1 unnamed protein product [Tilletia caries]CAD6958295.1 unnamed protein product [Tilletia laevis]CAD7068097.1 unnamed protein product [Tilletia caries]